MYHASGSCAPDSLSAQLDYMRGRWGVVLGQLIYRVLGGLDFIKEEEKAIFTGPGPVHVPTFRAEAQQASMALFGAGVSLAPGGIERSRSRVRATGTGQRSPLASRSSGEAFISGTISNSAGSGRKRCKNRIDNGANAPDTFPR